MHHVRGLLELLDEYVSIVVDSGDTPEEREELRKKKRRAVEQVTDKLLDLLDFLTR